MKKFVLACLLVAFLLPLNASAFCGFYVAKADSKLFNKASKVVLAYNEGRAVITMANDYQGDLKEFAIVIPVPTAITKEQVHVTSNALIDHLDAYSAPRLVEYFDENPCNMRAEMMMQKSAAPMAAMEGAGGGRAAALGVKIVDSYTVGEYDILILSAEQSDGLTTWLNESGYKLPEGANKVLGSYIKQQMKFFVAKVNLEAQAKTGFTYLRPLQVAYHSPKFMLPIRLGTLNANGPQDLILMTLTRGGRVEPANYRTVKIPSDKDIPLFVKDEFADFYRAMFDRASRVEGNAVFLEYAWDMGWCDPCAAEPLSQDELRELGVFWLNEAPRPVPMMGQQIMPPRPMPGSGVDVFVTRLHARYTAQTFPEDLMLQETGDRQNFQGRYVLRHPYTGDASCPEAALYRQSLSMRYQQEAEALARMTGWDINGIQSKMAKAGQSINPSSTGSSGGGEPFWNKIWKK